MRSTVKYLSLKQQYTYYLRRRMRIACQHVAYQRVAPLKYYLPRKTSRIPVNKCRLKKNISLTILITNSQNKSFITIHRLYDLLWTKSKNKPVKLPEEQRQYYWDVFWALRSAIFIYRASYIILRTYTRPGVPQNPYRAVWVALTRNKNKIKCIITDLKFARAHGFIRRKKWARRKRRVQRLRQKKIIYAH